MSHKHEHYKCYEHECHEHNSQDGCACGCHHHDEESERSNIIKIIICIALLIVGVVATKYFHVSSNIELIVFLAAYLVIAFDTIKETIEAIRDRQFLNENFLMVIASLGAFLIGEYIEAVAVMLLFHIGELFEHKAAEKSRKSITALMDIRPDYAWKKVNTEFIKVDPNEVLVNDIVQVKPGERVPFDGIVIMGQSSLNEQQLTGESIPRDIGVGEEIISGAVNISSVLEIKVSKEYAESTASKILDMVENATSNKAKAEDFITRFAKYYTPIVVILAVIIAIVPSIITKDYAMWIYRGLTFLVVSCPCALVISIPLTFFAGLGASSRNGILVKGGNYLEALSRLDTVVFDKTGTLTEGKFTVKEILPYKDCSKDDILMAATYAEYYSPHPIAKSLKDAYDKDIDESIIGETKEIPGRGLVTKINDVCYYVGNLLLMKELGINLQENESIGTIIYVAKDKEFIGSILIGDSIKSDTSIALTFLKNFGIKNTVMLTGDNKKTAETVAKNLCIPDVYSELLPGDKVNKVEELLENKNPNSIVAFVGDGMNDAPVLARADIGIAMGAMGSDAAIEASDVVIMDDKLSHLTSAISIARKTMLIVKENIVFSIGVKVLILVLAAFGIAGMPLAVFGDVGVMFIAVLNALRALLYKEK